MPDVAAQLRRARHQILALAVFLILSFAVGQYMQVRATHALAAAFDSSRAEFRATRIELMAASNERRQAIAVLGGIRNDLDALMDQGRVRSIANRRMFVHIASELQDRLDELSGVSDSMRAALPPRKRRQ